MTNIAATEGIGPQKVLVLHGWALDSSVWLTARWLSNTRDFTWAYVDFPGYGVARDQAPADGIDGMAATALAAADELGWSSFAVLGHSMGGATALRVATMRPQAVSAVAAVTPVSPAGTPLDAESYAAFDGAWADPAAAIHGHLSPNMEDGDLQRLVDRNRATMDNAVWSAYLRNWTSPDFLDELGAIDAPVGVFYGDSDPFVTAEYLAETVGALRSGELTELAGAGHYPMIEAPATSVPRWEQVLRAG